MNIIPAAIGWRFDEEGDPFSVHYEQLAPMLLNEVQRQQRTIATLLARLDVLESQHRDNRGAGSTALRLEADPERERAN